MINLEYIEDYYDKYKSISDNGLYSKYFAYRNIDTLYYSLLDNQDKSGTYWNDRDKMNYQKILIETLSCFFELNKIEDYCQYGCYADIFIKEYLNKVVKQQLIKNKEIYKKLLFSFNEANRKNIPEKYGYDYLIDDLAGLVILNLLSLNRKEQIKNVTSSYINDELECEVCKKKYKVIKFPKWLFYSFGIRKKYQLIVLT